MHWPPLDPDTSKAIADVLADVVKSRPAELLEYVAQKLQERSGLEPGAFEAHFEECKRKPRTYVLEEVCPAGQDPFLWVPMRYNDDTILLLLKERAMEMVTDILSQEPLEDGGTLAGRARVAFPELLYLRGAPEEAVAIQMLRAVSLVCSSCQNVLEQDSDANGMDDADPMLSFHCAAFVACARELLLEQMSENGAALAVEALIVCCLLRVIGRHAGFQERYGGGLAVPELAVGHALEQEAQSLPSFHRLGDAQRQLVASALQACFPFEQLLSTELVPASLARVKDLMVPCEGGVLFLTAVVAVEHMVQCRTVLVSDGVIDSVRLGAACLSAVEKYSAGRAYELFLKKRAERYSWRLVRDDLMQRATIRLCCLAGMEDADAWGEMLMVVEELPDAEKDVLKMELGRKDGIADVPVYAPIGAAALLIAAQKNTSVGLASGVAALCRVLGAASRTFDRSLSHRVVRLQLKSLAARAQKHTQGGRPFEETPFTLEEQGQGDVLVSTAGAA